MIAWLFWLISSAQAANFNDFLKEAPCSKAVREFLGPKESQRFWLSEVISQSFQPVREGLSLRDSRERVNRFLWQDGAKTHLQVIDKYKGVGEIHSWATRDACVKNVQSQKLQDNPGVTELLKKIKGTNQYKDENLILTLKSNAWGAIYVWSPHMPWSILGLKEIKKAVEKMNGHLTVLMDPLASSGAMADSLKRGSVTHEHTARVAARELIERNLGLHYPVLFVYKDQFISNRTYKGYKNPQAFEAWLKGELAEMKIEVPSSSL
jgi:hypothetical protein